MSTGNGNGLGSEYMTELHTDRDLLQALKRSGPATKAEREKQRLSFVMGSLSNSSSMTREQVQRVLEKQADDRKSA